MTRRIRHCRRLIPASRRVAALLAGAVMWTAATIAHGCERAEFEGVVSAASLTLRDMTARNTPVFQDKLRQLRDKRGWSYEQFLQAAAPLVTDDKIAAFDARSLEHLAQINNMGGEAASSDAPDCKLLDPLRASMSALVATQTEKWLYMFAKIEAEIAK
jgi:hypothetical protein